MQVKTLRAAKHSAKTVINLKIISDGVWLHVAPQELNEAD